MVVFHAIDNFRDLSDSVQHKSRICERSFYRSATLDYATEEDLDKLVQELKVNTILDLRSEVEAQLSKLSKSFVPFPVATALKLKPSDMVKNDPEASVHEKSDGPTRKTVMINFAGQKFRKFAVWKAAPLRLKMQIVGLVASGQKPKAVRLVGEAIIARKGLAGLYRDFVDYCDQEIFEALHVLSVPSNYPVLVHCTQGKDRTGLVVALALAAAGIEEEKIIEDYSKSQEGLERVRSHMVQEMAKDGLDHTFADAPADIMRQTFDYLREKYTNVEGYLDFIGFRKAERERLKKAMSFKSMQQSPQPPTDISRHDVKGDDTLSLSSDSNVSSVGDSSSASWKGKTTEHERALGAHGRRRTGSVSHVKHASANPLVGLELALSGMGIDTQALSQQRRSSSYESISTSGKNVEHLKRRSSSKSKSNANDYGGEEHTYQFPELEGVVDDMDLMFPSKDDN